MVERIIRRSAYVRRLEKELEIERLVCANKQKILDIITDHRDVLLANIRDLRIEASCLRKDKEALAWEISKLLDRNRRRAEGGWR
jgi:hypothetical protein